MATEKQMVPVSCRQVLIYHRKKRFPSYRSSLLCFIHFASVRSEEEEKEEARCFPLQCYASLEAWDTHAEGKIEHGCHKTLRSLSIMCDLFSPHPSRRSKPKLFASEPCSDCCTVAWIARASFGLVGAGRRGRTIYASLAACKKSSASQRTPFYFK